ncbi:MAG: DUF86 domain-containing protein [Candidatus Heimdallarchaeota archaeon]|nr:MAG: DUF86 domain-containing protein [Candidatus Heimdallarchaeota archaeon]
MNTKRVYIDFLNDIFDSNEKIEQFIEGMDYNQFEKDEKTSFAVIRAFEIIGEAAKEIPDEIKEKLKSKSVILQKWVLPLLSP